MVQRRRWPGRDARPGHALAPGTASEAPEDAVDQRAAGRGSGGDEGVDPGEDIHAQLLLRGSWVVSYRWQAPLDAAPP